MKLLGFIHHLLASFLLWSCGHQAANLSFVPPGIACRTAVSALGDHRLVAFGDSQTVGVMSQANGCDFSFTDVMSAEMGLPLVNVAVSGSKLTEGSSAGASEQTVIANTALTKNDTVVFVAGFNDGIFYGSDQAHLDDFRSAYDAALVSLSSRASTVIVGTTFRLQTYPSGGVFIGDSVSAALYAQEIRDSVQALNAPNVIFVDIAKLFIPDSSKFVSDQIHLNVDAQVEVAGIIKKAMEAK